MNPLRVKDMHLEEVKNRSRFEFGKNWALYLELIDDKRIDEATASLKKMLDIETLADKSFLDIGSGSGLFSLAAKKLGARVHSFDYDPASFRCTLELKKRYFENDSDWQVEIGSVLDRDYLKQLGVFDVVYSWGVLHHTGDMWAALNNATINVAHKGKLFIALYNDQGFSSKIWWWIKKCYVTLPYSLRWVILIPCYIIIWTPTTIRDIIKLKPCNTWNSYKKNRGMSPHRDLVDWVGGFPFEVSSPHEIFNFFKKKGFTLCQMKTVGGRLGCNEFVFERR
jgi:2-polyprenyl-3-methyl-5-hydroxy-6-metoxy-1,4-benzoquinol methylase